VLDISQDCTSKEIKDAYRELALVFHPDKPTGDPEMFDLITNAYNVLIDKKSRKEYDEIYALSKQVETSHFDLKTKSKNYFSAVDTDKTKKKTKEEQQIEFEKINEEMDRKRGYVREKKLTGQLSDKKTTKRLSDLQLAREQDDIESYQENLFPSQRPGQPIDMDTFNAVFDEMHKGQTELIPHVGNPLAYNAGISNFSSLDKYDDLYNDDDDLLGASDFCPIKLSQTETKKKLTKDDISKVSAAKYTKGHNYKDKDYNKSLEEKIKERQLQTQKLEDRSMQDFNDDPGFGGYGITEQLGVNVGSIDWDADVDIKTRYKRLLEMRKN
jgi:curved DNA-binding protein CbpA